MIFLFFSSWMIGFCVVYITRRALWKSKSYWMLITKCITTRKWRTRSRRFWTRVRCRHRRLFRRLRRMSTCTLTRRIRCRGCTRTRAARSTWYRQSSRARCRASRSTGKRTLIFRLITWMPWTMGLFRNSRVGVVVRCRRCRICSCICRRHFEVGPCIIY